MKSRGSIILLKFTFYHICRVGPRQFDIRVIATNYNKPPPPFGLTVYKGMKNVVINRKFAKFLLEHPVAIEFYQWYENDTYVTITIEPIIVPLIFQACGHPSSR